MHSFALMLLFTLSLLSLALYSGFAQIAHLVSCDSYLASSTASRVDVALIISVRFNLALPDQELANSFRKGPEN